MKTRIIHVNLLLLDANVIIDLHTLGLWDQVTKKYSVYVGSIVIHWEAYTYPDKAGQYQPIDLISQIGNTIQEVSATPQEISAVKSKFSSAFFDLHEGELESMAILLNMENVVFCTTDEAPIKAIFLLDKIDCLISEESMLKKAGLSCNKLESKGSEERFKTYIKIGQLMKMLGQGLT